LRRRNGCVLAKLNKCRLALGLQPSATAMREDVSPELSVLFFPSNQVQVLLNHPVLVQRETPVGRKS
jgi:hypothetical protein